MRHLLLLLLFAVGAYSADSSPTPVGLQQQPASASTSGNSNKLEGKTWEAPGTIGSTTPNTGAFSTISASGQITSTVTTGTAPFVIASTTVVPNLHAANSDQLLGSTWASPAAIGSGTPAAITGTAITGSSVTNSGLTSGRVVYSSTAGLETDDSGFTRSATTFTVDASTDGNYTLGYCKMGLASSGTSTQAYWGNVSSFSGTGYAMTATTTGITAINAASGQTVTIRNNNVTKYTFGSSSWSAVSGCPLTLNDTTAASSTGTGSLINLGGFGCAGSGYFNGATAAATQPSIVAIGTSTITGGVTDGTTCAIELTPTYSAGSAQTVTRHDYILCDQPTLSGAGPAALTDACVFKFNAAIGTHKAIDSGTTKTTPGTVTGWLKINVNGTVEYIPFYSSKTSFLSPAEMHLHLVPDDRVRYAHEDTACAA